jgi:hypothetical protein
MGNVGGNSFVHIDGDATREKGYIVINQVFGGNDMAGKIGTAHDVSEDIPSELTAIKRVPADETDSTKNRVNDTFNSYVSISTKVLSGEHYTAEEIAAAADNPENPAYGKKETDVKPDPDAKKIYIGQLYAGGNGDYDYQHSAPVDGKVTHNVYRRGEDNTPVATFVTNEGRLDRLRLRWRQQRDGDRYDHHPRR